ncbi:OmpA family protein [Cellulosimicrobium sp. NPDC057127]|uniref:OmpA family protein n=1 Tax=Cellulosimicrobium sp. NPDC057127 TaxID=3346026 RepID=UPI00364446F0
MRDAPRHAVLVAALAGALLVPAPAVASSGTTDDGAGTALPEDVVEHLAEDRERIEAADVTEAMRADAVLDLHPADATFPLDVQDATTRLETTREEDETTTVVLTADLMFAFDSAELSAEAADALTELIEQIPRSAAVAVDGHTDALGTDARNDELSLQRAEAVASVLRAERPDLALTVTGHGSRVPVAENTLDGEDNPAGRALNRRVELSFAAG